MPDNYSFDVVSDFDRQEIVNALDQTQREARTRYDLKDSHTEMDLEGNKITTKVDVAWNESWVGGEQVRIIRFEGDKLFIESPPMPHPNMYGKTVRVIVVWQRDGSFRV